MRGAINATREFEVAFSKITKHNNMRYKTAFGNPLCHLTAALAETSPGPWQTA